MSQHTMLTQATHQTQHSTDAQVSDRWDISLAYHKMSPLIGTAKRWHISAAYSAHTSNTSNSTNKHSLSQDGSSAPRDGTSQQHIVLTQATHLTAQTNTAYHKMGHLIGAAKRWQHTVLTQATHLTAQTNTAYHKMGHLIGAAKRWDISAAYCAHTSNTSNSTNKHSLSQDGLSDRSRQEMGHLSSILCSHKQHI